MILELSGELQIERVSQGGRASAPWAMKAGLKEGWRCAPGSLGDTPVTLVLGAGQNRGTLARGTSSGQGTGWVTIHFQPEDLQS